ncbi:hypothetical protein D9M69_423480 [compost metagenome]
MIRAAFTASISACVKPVCLAACFMGIKFDSAWLSVWHLSFDLSLTSFRPIKSLRKNKTLASPSTSGPVHCCIPLLARVQETFTVGISKRDAASDTPMYLRCI